MKAVPSCFVVNGRYKFSFISFIILLILNNYAFGQESSIKFKVVDSKFNGTIPFATVRIITPRETFGVVSNAEGDFQIPDAYFSLIDTVKISCIGYQTKNLSKDQLDKTQLNIVKLNESVMVLPEMVLQSKKTSRITPYKVFQAAIDNIPNNYPTSPTSYMAYYRDYQLEKEKYVNLNEAIVEIFDKGFKTIDQDGTKIVLHKYSKNENFESDPRVEIAYDNFNGNKFIPGASLSPSGGNELTILRIHDAIRNNKIFSYSFTNVFAVDFIKNHYLNFEEMTTINGLPLYHISFKSRPSRVGFNHIVRGDLYIERNNFAIHKLAYFAYEKGKTEEKLLYNIKLEYSRINSLMHLNYISFNNFFEVRDQSYFKVVNIVFNRIINAFIVDFNNKPDNESALIKENYKFSYDKSPLEIDFIKLSPNQSKQVYVYLKKGLVENKDPIKFAMKINAAFKGIKDMQGREIEKINYLQANQFRELFVQKITDSSTPADSLCVNKNKPLNRSKVNPMPNDSVSVYWMNTPLIKQ
jgi:hypothetical protein